jgi:hypothetical protein
MALQPRPRRRARTAMATQPPNRALGRQRRHRLSASFDIGTAGDSGLDAAAHDSRSRVVLGVYHFSSEGGLLLCVTEQQWAERRLRWTLPRRTLGGRCRSVYSAARCVCSALTTRKKAREGQRRRCPRQRYQDSMGVERKEREG